MRNQPYKLLFILIVSLLFSWQANAQVAAKPVEADSIVAVPLENIGTRTEETLSKIREIKSSIKPPNSELEIDSLIPVKLEIVEVWRKELILEDIEQMNLRQTESLKNDVNQLRSQLDGWRNTFSKRAEDVNGHKANLSEDKKLWDVTLKLKRETKLPTQVRQRIQNNLKEINELDKQLTERYNNLLTKQDELTGALIYIDEVLSAISKTEESYRLKIYTIDSPPIWEMHRAEDDTLGLAKRMADIIEAHDKDLLMFKENYQGNIIGHAIFFVVLLIILFYLKKEVGSWTDEKKDEAVLYSLHVISRPISSALLVSLLLTAVFYPDAPESVLDFYITLLVIPILTIIPGLIPSVSKKYFYFIAAAFVVSQFMDYFKDLVLLERAVQLLLDIVTVVLLLILIRNSRELREKEPRVKWGFAITFMRIGAFILSISIIANSVGNTILSRILSDGSMAMIYGGIIIYSSALVFKGLFALLIQNEHVAKLNMIKNYPDEVKHHLFRGVRILAVLYWLYLTLTGYLIYEPLYESIDQFLTREWGFGDVTITVGNILAFFIVLWISLTLSRFINFLLQDEILTHFEMPRGVPGAISMIVRLVLIVVGFLLAFGAARIDLSNITIIFGALGVGIGFGLQNIFNNLISGLILAFERPIQVGDIIQIASLNLMGEVKEIGIRASNVRTFDGAEVIVPNGNFISNEMINWTLSDSRRRQEILVGVAYGTDTNKVLEILNRVVPEQENVLKNPGPLILFVGFGESSLDFRVLFWTHFDNGLGAKSRVGTAIDEEFKKEGIEIPFPQRDLHLKSISDSVDLTNLDSTNGKKPANRTSKATTSKKPQAN